MRTGRLETPADLLELGADLQPLVIDWLWFGIRAKDSGDVQAATGLRNPGKVEARCWWDDRLLPGRFLRAEGRLLHIDSVRDVTGQQSELTITATELIGQQASYTPAGGGTAKPCRVHLTHGVARAGDLTGKAEYTTQAEVALIEVGRPQSGAQLLIGSDTWRITGLVDDDDDRITRRMWVKRL